VELGAAGAAVYVTGRSTCESRSEYDRPETIEDTAALVTEAGGIGIAVAVDHLQPSRVRSLVRRIDDKQGRPDLLVNDIGGEHFFEWRKPFWECDLDKGLRMLRIGLDTHLITSHVALPLMIRRSGCLVVEVTDGTDEFNRAHYRGEGGTFFDLTKMGTIRLALAQAEELRPHGGTAVAVTSGWLRSESMLDLFGVTEQNWRHALETEPNFCVSETPRFVGRAIAALAADPDVSRWSGQSVSSGHLAKVYGFTDARLGRGRSAIPPGTGLRSDRNRGLPHPDVLSAQLWDSGAWERQVPVGQGVPGGRREPHYSGNAGA
jgi:NAD(P)-dependent dehydrogenase (short-subunit alcohol dehydrogenase family)